MEEDHVGGRRADDMAWPLIEQRLDAFEREMRSRFESMEMLLNQRIRHGDATTEASVNVFIELVRKIDARTERHDERLHALESQQLSWKSNLKLLSFIIGGSTGAGGIAGTIIGLSVGG